MGILSVFFHLFNLYPLCPYNFNCVFFNFFFCFNYLFWGFFLEVFCRFTDIPH